jgi:hypothetical protein
VSAAERRNADPRTRDPKLYIQNNNGGIRERYQDPYKKKKKKKEQLDAVNKESSKESVRTL